MNKCEKCQKELNSFENKHICYDCLFKIHNSLKKELQYISNEMKKSDKEFNFEKSHYLLQIYEYLLKIYLNIN